MRAHGQKLMDPLFDPRTKGNRSILSFQRWNQARVLLEIEYARSRESIKMTDHIQLKAKIKGLASKRETQKKLNLAQTILMILFLIKQIVLVHM